MKGLNKMAICDWCDKEMKTADGCSGNKTIIIKGKEYDSIPFHDDDDETIIRCHDCNVKSGEFHHPGCDAERCPICGGQIISCDCLDDSFGEDV